MNSDRIVESILTALRGESYNYGMMTERLRHAEAEIKRLQTVQTMQTTAPAPAEVTVFRTDPVAVRELLAATQEHKISTIKAVRSLSQLGLKEAKDLVESAIPEAHWQITRHT